MAEGLLRLALNQVCVGSSPTMLTLRLIVMKKCFNPKIGDNVIYISGFIVKESEVVPKPIDDNERPLFRAGRIDLSNGDYLLNGTVTYDSVEEAENAILEKVDKEIKNVGEEMSLLQIRKLVLESVKDGLLKKHKNED